MLLAYPSLKTSIRIDIWSFANSRGVGADSTSNCG